MVKVDIFRDRNAGCDIIIIDTEQYIGGNVFNYIVQYLRSHLSMSIPLKDQQICLEYRGIAIRLNTFLDDRISAKNEFKLFTEEALQILN